jgi:hypothetical protein
MMWDIECTRWFTGRCLVVCVQVKDRLWESCLIRVTSMHYIKSRIQGGSLGGFGW